MKQDKNTNAFRFYSFLLNLYPSSFAKEFRSQMLQTFKDHYTDVYEREGKVGIGFWFEAITDDLWGVTRAQSVALKKIPAYLIAVILTPLLFLGSILVPPVISLFSIYVIEVTFLLFAYFLIKKFSGMKMRSI